MLRLMKQHVTTFMSPLVDHVDHLFKAVESLGSDLAVEQAKSRKRCDEFSLRLDDIDVRLSSHIMKVANAVEKQQDLDVAGWAQFDQWFAEVLEPVVQEQNDCQTDRLRNLHGQMQALLVSLVQPTMEHLQETIKEQVDSFSRRLSATEAVCRNATSSLQEHTFSLGLLGDVVDGALKTTHEAVRDVARQQTGTSRSNMEASMEEQQRKMSALRPSELDKLSDIPGRMDQVSKSLKECHARLAENFETPRQAPSAQSSTSPVRSGSPLRSVRPVSPRRKIRFCTPQRPSGVSGS